MHDAEDAEFKVVVPEPGDEGNPDQCAPALRQPRQCAPQRLAKTPAGKARVAQRDPPWIEAAGAARWRHARTWSKCSRAHRRRARRAPTVTRWPAGSRPRADLLQVRRARCDLLAAACERAGAPATPLALADRNALARLAPLDRYEQRALARRRLAVRAFDASRREPDAHRAFFTKRTQ